MAELFLNPNLPDYFMQADEVNSGIVPRSYVKEYEAAKVITFPNFKLNIDFDFWAKLDVDQFTGLKKLSHSPIMSELGNMEEAVKKMKKRGVPEDLIAASTSQMVDIYKQVLHLYLGVFSEYEFERPNVVWRLNTIRAENLHLDTPAEPSPYHFARMFVNLDNQPRIWQVSWPIEDVMGLMKGKVPKEILDSASSNELWAYLNRSTFGKSSKEWWDDQPRHLAFFAPGDVWVVDSRQVSHQIFYGRKAVSIDFYLKPEHMQDPGKHYLAIAERFRSTEMRG